MLTVSTAVGLSGLAAGYAAVTRPLLRSTEAADSKPWNGPAADLATPESDLAKRFLPDQPWAADAAYTVRNGRAVMFFNKFERIPGGNAIELKPFAMMYPPKEDRAGDLPLTVIGERAILQVEGAIDDIATADPGRITGGRMPGLVQLRGPDGLELVGTNFHFHESPEPQIWSDEAVAFRQGGHSGRGTGATLEMFRVGDPAAFESIAANGVRRIRLRKDVEMDLRFAGGEGGPFASLSGGEPKPPAEGEEPLPTRITCSGAFTFDCRTNIATFETDVLAERAVPGGGPSDSLECDAMTVTFRPKTPEGQAAHAERWAKVDAGSLVEDDGFAADVGELDIVWLDAYGKKAVLRSPSNEFVADLNRLTYEASTGITTLTRDDGNVVSRQGTSVLASPKVVIEPVEGASPKISCIGKGWLRHEETPGRLALQAIWGESLQRLRGTDGLDQIRLVGAAEVTQPQENFILKADRIDLWLDPKEGEATTPGTAPAGRTLVGSGRMEPVRLTAAKVGGDKVRLRSPELLADANTLDVTFAERDPIAATTAARAPRTGLAPASGRILLASAERPAPVAGTAGSANGPPAPPKPANPIVLDTDAMTVIVDRSQTARTAPATAAEPGAAIDRGRGGEVREVHTTGGVVVVQKREEGQAPLTIQGDRLDLFNRGKDQELVNIYGKAATVGSGGEAVPEKPARVLDQESELWGMNINLDRRENVAWVEGRGVLRLPVKDTGGLLGAAGEDRPVGREGGQPARPQRLDVWWQERMRFDGDKAVFFGTVQTQLDGNVMSCEEMEVRLTARFDFAAADRGDAAGSAARPEVAEVHCKHEVLVYGEEAAEGDKAAAAKGEAKEPVVVRKAKFYEFRLDRRTGDTHAFGPGEIEQWQKGDGKRAGLAADNAVQANSTARRAGDWEYLRVTFQGTSEGNINRKSTTFDRGVQVVYGPVPDKGRTIDPDRPEWAPAEAGWMTSERLTLTRHDKTETSPVYSEVEAGGNVRLDGRGFSGMADQVTYDESKAQYILKSFGNNVATIAKTLADKNGTGEWSGREIHFYTELGTARVIQSKGGEGRQ